MVNDNKNKKAQKTLFYKICLKNSREFSHFLGNDYNVCSKDPVSKYNGNSVSWIYNPSYYAYE